ncbi:unnamed protein product [Brassica oleracea var. botrytis]
MTVIFFFQIHCRLINHLVMSSILSNVLPAPEDPVLSVIFACRDDPCPVKLNVSARAYRTEEGKPLVLEVVRKAEQQLANDLQGYLPIDGLADFNKLSAKLTLGDDSHAVEENRVVTIQCLSGMLEDLGAAPSGAIVVLQSCAHNPTGIDPTLEQWEKIRQIVRSKGLLPFFDNAYQVRCTTTFALLPTCLFFNLNFHGFATGNLDSDAQSVCMFVADGGECLIAQSFAKNMGLYGERIGTLTIVCTSQDVARKVHSQVLLVVRPMYLSPPIHGASIVTTILKNSDMYKDWTIELKGMADRIISMRQQLYEAIQARGTPGDWTHIIKQIGMFSFTGLNKKQVRWMAKEYHIYMTYDGRISIASLSSKTVPQLADAIHAAVTRIA